MSFLCCRSYLPLLNIIYTVGSLNNPAIPSLVMRSSSSSASSTYPRFSIAVFWLIIALPPVALDRLPISSLSSLMVYGVISMSTERSSKAEARRGNSCLACSLTTLNSRDRNSIHNPFSSLTFNCASINIIFRASPLIGVDFIFSMLMSGSCRDLKKMLVSCSM